MADTQFSETEALLMALEGDDDQLEVYLEDRDVWNDYELRALRLACLRLSMAIAEEQNSRAEGH